MTRNSKIIPAFFGLALGLGMAGCKTVVRENIISTIETGIGINVAENPKTELYEVKAGFIRSQFYSVPTGKLVENEKKSDGTGKVKDANGQLIDSGRKDMRSNQADITPELVSGIRTKSGVEHLVIGMEVSESFAVGKVAVMSPAAVAMYIAEAKNSAAAQSAAEGVKSAASMARAQIETEKLQTKKIMDHLNAAPVPAGGPNFTAKLKELAKGTTLENQAILDTIDATSLEKKLNNTWSTYVGQFYNNLPADKK